MSAPAERLGSVDPVATERAKAIQAQIAQNNHKEPLDKRNEWLFRILWSMRDPKKGGPLLTTEQAGAGFRSF